MYDVWRVGGNKPDVVVATSWEKVPDNKRAWTFECVGRDCIYPRSSRKIGFGMLINHVQVGANVEVCVSEEEFEIEDHGYRVLLIRVMQDIPFGRELTTNCFKGRLSGTRFPYSGPASSLGKKDATSTVNRPCHPCRPCPCHPCRPSMSSMSSMSPIHVVHVLPCRRKRGGRRRSMSLRLRRFIVHACHPCRPCQPCHPCRPCRPRHPYMSSMCCHAGGNGGEEEEACHYDFDG